jgi:hypothetical protein
MPITESLVLAHNAAHARIPLTDARAAELPVELNQLAEAAEAARRFLQFDSEPAAFTVVLHALAWED